MACIRNKNKTKRTLLSQTSKLFDPLEWLAPTIISNKIRLQKNWIEGIEWDQQLFQYVETEWLRARIRLSLLKELKFPRRIFLKRQVRSFQFHIFTDVCEAAYAAAV